MENICTTIFQKLCNHDKVTAIFSSFLTFDQCDPDLKTTDKILAWNMQPYEDNVLCQNDLDQHPRDMMKSRQNLRHTYV